MKKILILLLTAVILMTSACVVSYAAITESHYDGDDATLYYTSNPDLKSAYCWTDLTYKIYDTGTRTVKADCGITYKNSYPNKFHNCVELRIFTSSNASTASNFSNTERSVVVSKDVATNFTWCYANHGVNTCGRTVLTPHSNVHDSGSDSDVLFTTIRVN